MGLTLPEYVFFGQDLTKRLNLENQVKLDVASL